MDNVQKVNFDNTTSSQTFRSKGKAVQFKYHAVSAYGDRGGDAPLIVDFSGRWKDMAAYVLPLVPLDGRLAVSGRGNEKENKSSRIPVVKPTIDDFTA